MLNYVRGEKIREKFSQIEDKRYDCTNYFFEIEQAEGLKLKKYLKQWALSESGWFLAGDKKNQTYDLSFIEGDESEKERYQSAIFYKERWLKEDGLEQKLIVTFSFKFQDYQRHIRNSQIDRAKKCFHLSLLI